jgi:hypothetical protein
MPRGPASVASPVVPSRVGGERQRTQIMHADPAVPPDVRDALTRNPSAAGAVALA